MFFTVTNRKTKKDRWKKAIMKRLAALFLTGIMLTASGCSAGEKTAEESQNDTSAEAVVQGSSCQWILVKGRDGSRGYMYVKDGMVVDLDKPAKEVFSDLYFTE